VGGATKAEGGSEGDDENAPAHMSAPGPRALNANARSRSETSIRSYTNNGVSMLERAFLSSPFIDCFTSVRVALCMVTLVTAMRTM